MAAKIKKGDRVVVLTGKDKGRQGKVTRVFPAEEPPAGRQASTWSSATRVRARANPQGGIVNKEATIHVSNVAHVDPRPASRPASASAWKATRRCGSPRSPARSSMADTPNETPETAAPAPDAAPADAAPADAAAPAKAAHEGSPEGERAKAKAAKGSGRKRGDVGAAVGKAHGRVAKTPDGQAYEPRMKQTIVSGSAPRSRRSSATPTTCRSPRLDKIVVNMGIGEAVADSKKADAAMKDLAAITGQKPLPTKARRAVAAFKLREDMVVGAKVTLRKDRMYEFLDRLITIALPRVETSADSMKSPSTAAATSPWA